MSIGRAAALVGLLGLITAGGAAAQTPPAPPPAKPAPWWERITFNGDFRGRYEGFLQDDQAARHRERFRLRLGVGAKITDEVTFGVRVASGDPGDITSTNQSFGDFLSRKPILVDQVFLLYSPAIIKPLTIGAGKFPYPVTRTQLTWDDDVNWEGTYQQLAWAPPQGTSFKLVAVQSPINESAGDDDAFLFVHYAQAGWKLGKHALQVSVADYLFTQPDAIAVGFDTRRLRNVLTNRLRRNAAGQVTGFVSRFNVVDAIAQATLATRRAAYPVTLLADVATNTRAAPDEDMAVWLVAGYGRAAAPRTFAMTYTFARIEREAVLTAFNYSDIPPSNVRMHQFGFSVMPRARLNLDATAILTKLLRVPAGAPNALLKRIQLDARVTF